MGYKWVRLHPKCCPKQDKIRLKSTKLWDDLEYGSSRGRLQVLTKA